MTYALLRQDFAIIVSAFFQALTSGLIVAIKLSRQARMQRQAGLPSRSAQATDF